MKTGYSNSEALRGKATLHGLQVSKQVGHVSQSSSTVI